VRVIAYWVTCQITFVLTMMWFSFLEGPSQEPASLSRLVVPALFISSLVLPIAVLDLLVFSNRFAGPMFNFRRKLRELVEGGTTEKVYFRAGDFYPDIRDNFNHLLERMETQPVEFSDQMQYEEREPVGTSAG